MNDIKVVSLHLVSILTALGCTHVFKTRVIDFLYKKHLIVNNYAGNRIATGGGLILLFPCLIAVFPYIITGFSIDILLYLMIVLSLSMAGLVDDLLGDRSSKGLAGHARTFIKGGFTTGGLKAIIGGIVGILVATARYMGVPIFLMDVLIFTLCVNLINLFDLRPGRAIKGFTIIIFALLLSSGFSSLWIVIPLFTVLSLYYRGELLEQYMLGDAGANLVGGILGLYGVISLALPGKILLSSLLIILHLLAEFYSFSKWIDTVPILRYIDRIGRKNWRKTN